MKKVRKPCDGPEFELLDQIEPGLLKKVIKQHKLINVVFELGDTKSENSVRMEVTASRAGEILRQLKNAGLCD